MKSHVVRFIPGGVLVVIGMILLSCVPPGQQQPIVEEIKTEGAPAAIGPYSQAIRVGGILFCSGQIPLDPNTGEIVQEGIEAETRQVMENLGAVLRAAGMDYSNVVKATVFLSDLNDYAAMNKVYATYFEENPPAREAVEVGGIAKGAGVEISFIAVKTR